MLMTDVEAMILRNQLAIMRVQIRGLVGRIDRTANEDRDLLRARLYATGEALGMKEEEVL